MLAGWLRTVTKSKKDNMKLWITSVILALAPMTIPPVVRLVATAELDAQEFIGKVVNAGQMLLERPLARSKTAWFDDDPVIVAQAVHYGGVDGRDAETPAAGKTVVTGKSKNGPATKLVSDTRQYEETLNDLAAKAQKIVNDMPSDPSKIAKNFGDLGDVLRKAKKHLNDILVTRPDLDAKASKILDGAAGVQQQFIDLGKKIDQQIKDVRAKQNSDNPVSVTAGLAMLEGVKRSCKSGELVMVPLRDHVQAAQLTSAAVFSEIEMYPPIFDLTIQACDLYKSGIGDSTLYLGLVQDLIKARENLKTIVGQFEKAAEKAEKMLKEIPAQGLSGVPLQ